MDTTGDAGQGVLFPVVAGSTESLDHRDAPWRPRGGWRPATIDRTVAVAAATWQRTHDIETARRAERRLRTNLGRHLDTAFESTCFRRSSFDPEEEFLLAIRRDAIAPDADWMLLADLFVTESYAALEPHWTLTVRRMGAVLASWWTPARVELLDSLATHLHETHDAQTLSHGFGMGLDGFWKGTIRSM